MKELLHVRKTYMTLLETLIAMTILSILLVFVFGFFRELSHLTHLSDQSQKESFQMRYLESRLNYIFERIVNEKQDDKNKTRTFFFYTEPANKGFSKHPSLIFTFNNEIRKDPMFSGDVLGRLYVDNDHQFRLAIWPLHVEQPQQFMQEEILFHNVMNIKYCFYCGPERISNDKDITSGKKIDPEKKTPERDKWHEEGNWEITYNEMPSIIKIIVEVAKKPEDLKESQARIDTKEMVFHFVLPSSKNPIYYPPD